MAKRSGSTATGGVGTPSAEAREALALWGLAFRYASAAALPVAKQTAAGLKSRMSAAISGESSLKDRLDPSKTEKGGKVGDAADALLEKMGAPGKLAAKASLGSRAVGRLAPGTADEPPEAEANEEDEEPDRDDVAADAAEGEDGEPVAEEDVRAEDEAPDQEEDEDEPTAESDAVEEESEPVEGHPGADPLHTDFDHAYSDEVENYEHQDAYATPR